MEEQQVLCRGKYEVVQYYLCVCLVKNYMKEGEEKEEEEVDEE